MVASNLSCIPLLVQHARVLPPVVMEYEYDKRRQLNFVIQGNVPVPVVTTALGVLGVKTLTITSGED
jgi:hypothetical protein